MKKKERAKLKQFIKSDEWQKSSSEKKLDFISHIAKSTEFTRKDRKSVCKMLLSVVK